MKLLFGIVLFSLLFTSVVHASVHNSTIGPSTLYSGLVGWWTFDGEDTNWATGKTNDRSLNGNNGQLIGMSTTTSPVPGRMGQALSFNATGSYVAIGTGPSTVDSVSFWMEAATSTNEQILELSGTQTVSSSGGTLSANGFSSPTIYVDGTVSSAIDTKWHLVTITTASPFSASAMNIGKIGAGYFGGILDDVRVYSRVLSATEVSQLYNVAASGHANAPQAGPPGKNGMLAWYTFDGKGVMKSIADSSGAGNTATPFNFGATTTTLTVGKAGQAINFYGTNSTYIQTPITGPIGTGSYSYAVWFKTTVPQLAGLISRRDNSGAPQFSLNISNAAISGSGNLLSIVDNDGTLSRSGVSSGSVTDGKWHFAAIVRDANTSSTLGYLDGALAITSNSTAIPNLIGTDNIMVGAAGDGGTAANFFLTGSLDDARIYSRALSAAEVLQIYKASGGSKVQTSSVGPANLNNGLVGWWTFDGEDTNWATGITNDRSGNGNNGQLIGMSTTSSPALGKIGQAFSFNGSNSSIAIPSISSVESVSFWAKPNSTTQSILDLNGTQTIDISAGTVRGNSWSSPTIYVDAVQTAAFPDTKWHFVTITTVTPFNATAMTMGKISSAFYKGLLDDVRLYSRVLSATDVQELYDLAH